MIDAADVDSRLAAHLAEMFMPEDVVDIGDRFRRFGFFNFGSLMPAHLLALVRNDVTELIREQAERRDIRLQTTGGTPRHMKVVTSDQVEQGSELIRTIASSKVLLDFVGSVAGEQVYARVSEDERFLITHQDRMADTHGWHWGDYSYALIWALTMPPLACGGMLQCVPHTHWNKQNPRVNEILCQRQIDTHALVSGDIYLLRTDTTLHRTVPLTEHCERTILNMTWAADRDFGKPLVGDDRWWADPGAGAARAADA